MRKSLLAAAGLTAIAAAGAALAQIPPSSGAVSGAFSVAGAGSSAVSGGSGGARASSSAGNVSFGGASANSGQSSANPSLNVHSVNTYSGSIGGTTGSCQSNGTAACGAGGVQGGAGGGLGWSFDPVLRQVN
jgi:hypothetical protein